MVLHTLLEEQIVQNGKEKGKENNIQQALKRVKYVGALTTTLTLKFGLHTLGKTIYLRLSLALCVILFSNPSHEQTYWYQINKTADC